MLTRFFLIAFAAVDPVVTAALAGVTAMVLFIDRERFWRSAKEQST